MSKIQRRNNQEGVTHVADLLPTGRALAPREPVRCDLPPVAQNLAVPAAPWLPPQPEGFTPWVEWSGQGSAPVPNGTDIMIVTRIGRGLQECSADADDVCTVYDDNLRWGHGPSGMRAFDIVAYCVRANPVDAAKLAFDRKTADALRHASDSEGGHVD